MKTRALEAQKTDGLSALLWRGAVYSCVRDQHGHHPAPAPLLSFCPLCSVKCSGAEGAGAGAGVGGGGGGEGGSYNELTSLLAVG